MGRLNIPKVLRLTTITPTRSEQDTAVTNINGTIMNVFNAQIIRALSKGLGIPLEIVMPEDNSYGRRKPDGNWSGMVGMVVRGEADLTVSGLTANNERREVVNFTFPLYVSEVSFMTNKPEPYPKSFAIFDIFSIEVWICIGICLGLISFILYILLNGKKAYSTVLMETIGNLLEQSFSFEVRQRNTVSLLFMWFLGITVLTASYKGVILSVITYPRLVGIRDISDLAKASERGSVKCISYKGGIPSVRWYELNDDKLRAIADCMKRSEMEGLYSQGAFREHQQKKAFIADRLDFEEYERDYFISDDDFALSHLGIAYSRNFCCPKELDNVVHHIVAADLYAKTLRDRTYMAKLRLPAPKIDDYDKTRKQPLKAEDFIGAFIVLFIGYISSFLIFTVEILIKKRKKE